MAAQDAHPMYSAINPALVCGDTDDDTQPNVTICITFVITETF